MRTISFCLAVSTLAAWLVGCAETGVSCPPDQRLVDGDECLVPLAVCLEEGKTKPIEMFCLASGPIPTFTLQLVWDLTVAPRIPIRAGEDFAILFRLKVRFPESIINLGLADLGAFDTMTITAAEARIQVRRGATPEGEVLLRADLPPEGMRIFLEKNDDCSGDGECAALGHAPDGACARTDFCVTKPVEFELESEGTDFFAADESGSVLFGLREPAAGPSELGLNRGVFDLEERTYGAPIVSSGVDVLLADSIPFAFECVMAVNSRGPDGVGTATVQASPSPDGAYIACPIQERE